MEPDSTRIQAYEACETTGAWGERKTDVREGDVVRGDLKHGHQTDVFQRARGVYREAIGFMRIVESLNDAAFIGRLQPLGSKRKDLQG